MNRDWIYCTTLICQQRIENSMVNKNLWKKSKKTVSENPKSTIIINQETFYYYKLLSWFIFTKLFQ